MLQHKVFLQTLLYYSQPPKLYSLQNILFLQAAALLQASKLLNQHCSVFLQAAHFPASRTASDADAVGHSLHGDPWP
jgi:hypothetical protein